MYELEGDDMQPSVEHIYHANTNTYSNWQIRPSNMKAFPFSLLKQQKTSPEKLAMKKENRFFFYCIEDSINARK